jgi:hypothetical protein
VKTSVGTSFVVDELSAISPEATFGVKLAEFPRAAISRKEREPSSCRPCAKSATL